MKSVGRGALRAAAQEAVRIEIEKQAAHYDLCWLWTLHATRGYGAQRLEETYRDFHKVYEEFKRRYFDEDDIKVFGSRSDTYAFDEELKAIGFNYEKLVEELRDEQAD